jgi:hypothetical protein
MTEGERAIDRLSPEERAGLTNIAASWKMEGADLSDQALEILARYMLNEISADECDAQLDALD